MAAARVAGVTASTTGGIAATTTEDGWLRIPELPRAQREAWVAEVVGELREAWGEAWDDRAELMVPTMLAETIGDRPDAHVVFEVWPFAVPARARVQISMLDAATVPDLQQLGFSLVPYDGAAAGPGLMLVRRSTEAAEDGEGVRLVDWGVLFDDGTHALLVQVDTLPLFFLQRILPGLHGLVVGLGATLPDGRPFRAAPSAHALTDADGEWSALRLRAEGLAGDDAEAR